MARILFKKYFNQKNNILAFFTNPLMYNISV